METHSPTYDSEVSTAFNTESGNSSLRELSCPNMFTETPKSKAFSPKSKPKPIPPIHISHIHSPRIPNHIKINFVRTATPPTTLIEISIPSPRDVAGTSLIAIVAVQA